MASGEPSIIGLVGGSITAGMGAYEAGRMRDAWSNRLTRWAAHAFPKGNVKVVNGGVKAVGSDYMAVCVKAHIPADADLIFVELAINDPPSFPHEGNSDMWREIGITAESRRSFERLVRKLLNLPRRPAVVLLNSYSWFQARPVGAYYHNSEAVYFEFATYYSLPLISVKAAVYHLMAANVHGFSVAAQRYMTNANESNPSDVLYYHDEMHPAGHTGHRVLAELCIYTLLHVFRGLNVRPFNVKELKHTHARLPRPMLVDNYESANDTCFLGNSLKEAMVEAQGFQWHNEAPPDRSPKWGWTATAPGHRITLQLSTMLDGAKGDGKTALVMVYLSLLKSYQHMGRAQVTCEAGCTCSTSIFEGHTEQRTSQLAMHMFRVSQAPRCIIAVAVLPQTTSGEHKVKIGGLMLSESSNKIFLLEITASSINDIAAGIVQ